MKNGSSGGDVYNIGSAFQNPTGDPEYNGKDGDDRITGTAGANLIIGELGNDTINAGGGADVLWGDYQNNTLSSTSDGKDSLSGGSGNDVINGGGGNAVLTYAGGSITFAETQLSVLQGLTAQGWVLG
jgi:Ca2+-binding RTX toxin-like protein